MITGDLDEALSELAAGAVGRWRPPPGGGSGAGTYATALPSCIGEGTGGSPAAAGEALAAHLRARDWIAAASVAGSYLNVTVTADALARVAVRITLAGEACASSTALAGVRSAPPAAADLAQAPGWQEAHALVHAAALSRLAAAAGGQPDPQQDSKRLALADRPALPQGVSVADAVAFAGVDAIIYALARTPEGTAVSPGPRLAAAHHLDNPAFAVRYAHAHAASCLRQAADLGLSLGDAGAFQPRALAHPSELSLLYELSWLPERAARAARLRRPEVFAHYLERLAASYLACQAGRPAMGPGIMVQEAAEGVSPGEGTAPVRPAPEVVTARLWLAAAAQTALGTGLRLLGVSAPDRL